MPRIGMAIVRGRSMLPTLVEGDRLLVSYAARARVGDLLVVRLPDGTVAVKRAGAHLRDGWWVERDNPREGVDSARVGVIAEAEVLGVVRARLWPRPVRRLPPPAPPADPAGR